MSLHLAGPVGYVSQAHRIVSIKVIAAVTGALVLVSHTPWERQSLAAGLIGAMGLCLVMAAVLGRLWATLYIGGRKNAALVTAGPYSITRNPLYCGSVVGAAGIGLIFGSLAIAAALASLVALVLMRAARAEAVLLRQGFGEEYERYAARVPLFWPRPSLYRDAGPASFQPQALGRALRDGLLFLLAVPAAELVALLKDAGLPPPLMILP